MDDHGFEARLRHLEYILYGQQQQQNKSTNEVIIKRMELLRKELSSIYQNNKSIKYFIEKCNVYTCKTQLKTHR